MDSDMNVLISVNLVAFFAVFCAVIFVVVWTHNPRMAGVAATVFVSLSLP